MLTMIDDLQTVPVCPSIYDPALVDMAESKSKSLLYFVDPKGAIEDGEVVKCIRSIRPLFLEQESLYLLILKKIMANNHGTGVSTTFYRPIN